ncbi:MAG: hypothetical protein NTY98_25955 [Verrucomicrobia bacterium]|nr:hypothetical protein [Verrucomicrobiota bacterium]
MILEITASANGGFCGACVKTRGLRYHFRQIGFVVLFVVGLLVMPFVSMWWGIRNAWRHWRFPFDRFALFVAIRTVSGDADIARSYLDGVVEGYRKSTPENQAVFTSNRARHYGEEDGGRLRRGEITISDIPTHRPSWLSEENFRRFDQDEKT